MTEKIRDKISLWLRDAAEDPGLVRSRHLDELGIAKLYPDMELLHEVFRAGVDGTRELGGQWLFSLMVPLMVSEELDLRRIRQIDSYLERQSDIEPASVYLLTSDQGLVLPRVEQYRFPLEHRVPGLEEDTYHVFFYQRRWEGDIEFNDVFYNRIYFDQISPSRTSG